MLEPLSKDVHVTGAGGLWGVFNNARQLTCSTNGYMLAIAREDIKRLDDMSAHEERQFWDFTFTRATAGLNDSSNRGHESSPAPQSTKPCSVICAMNDGLGAWQNIGTTHCHIIWTPGQDAMGDISKRLHSDRSFFTGSAGGYAPHAQTDVVLKPRTYADDIRKARQSLSSALKGKFNNPAESPSFSIYTSQACNQDPRSGNHVVIEAWSEDHHSVFSLSQAVRYWNNLWDSPLNPAGNSPSLKYSGFRRKP